MSIFTFCSFPMRASAVIHRRCGKKCVTVSRRELRSAIGWCTHPLLTTRSNAKPEFNCFICIKSERDPTTKSRVTDLKMANIQKKLLYCSNMTTFNSLHPLLNIDVCELGLPSMCMVPYDSCRCNNSGSQADSWANCCTSGGWNSVCVRHWTDCVQQNEFLHLAWSLAL